MNAKELAGSISRFVGQIKPTNNPSDDAVIKGFPEWFIEDLENSATMLRQQADRIAELEKGEEVAGRFYWESVVDGHVMAVPSEGTPHYNKDDFPLYTTPQIKELSDEELNKAFDYYCETDEGVLRFNYELRDKWKKEQLIRWKEAFKKASEK